MRTWSRDLREATVRGLAGLGLVLALAVLGAALVSTAVQGDEKGANAVALVPHGGFGNNDAANPTPDDSSTTQQAHEPSHAGVLLGVFLLTGGVAVLGWGARRPKSETTTHRVLQSVSD